MNARTPLGWGLIGASDIARTRMAAAINGQPDSRVVAVMSSQAERARASPTSWLSRGPTTRWTTY